MKKSVFVLSCVVLCAAVANFTLSLLLLLSGKKN